MRVEVYKKKKNADTVFVLAVRLLALELDKNLMILTEAEQKSTTDKLDKQIFKTSFLMQKLQHYLVIRLSKSAEL